MNRTDVIKTFGALRGDAAAVVGPGLAGYQIAEHADHALTLYNQDMAYVSATALGMALAWPDRKVVAIEGDGSMLMGLTALVEAATAAPRNLVIIVFDNGVYLTTGSGEAPTPTAHGTDIEAIARGAGFPKAATVLTIEQARAVMAEAMRDPGPWLVVAKVDTSDREQSGGFVPLPTDVFEGAQRFRTAAMELRFGGQGPARVSKY
jgi:thiamine pyrophosphate-dependent acetolactate synthase large subunit-like protein